MLWKDKYALGVSLIDRQHMELFGRVDAFLQTLRSSAAWDEKARWVGETLEFMNGYVVEHFREEEGYQERIGYPGSEAHRKAHTDMVDYVLEITAQFHGAGCSEALMQQFAGRLMAWLIHHVASEDQRIAAYAVKAGVLGDD